MPSNRTPTRFYGPAKPEGGGVTLYTVPANKIAVIKQIICDPSDPTTLILGVGGTGSSARVFTATFAGSEESSETWEYLVLVEADTLQASVDADSVAVTVNGDLYDV